MELSLMAAQPRGCLAVKLNKVRQSFIEARKNFARLCQLCGSYFFIACGAMLLFTGPAYADCTGPAGAESATRYDFAGHKLYYCNGTNWVELGGNNGGALQATLVSCSSVGCVANCPSGWVRSGCNHVGSSGGVNSSPANGCSCNGSTVCQAICIRM